MLQSLIEIGYNVVDVFDADGEADEFGADAACQLLFSVELGVGGGGRVDGEGFGVAEVGNVGEHLEGVDEFGTSFGSAFDAEDDDAAAFAAEVFLVLGVFGIVFEAGEADPFDTGVIFEMLGDGEGVFAMALHAEREGFDALEELPGVIGRDAGSEVAEGAGAHAEDVGEGGEHVGEVVSPAEAVVRVVGIVKEGVFSAGPVEATGVDDDAAEAGAVSAEPLGEGVDDDVGSVLKRVGQVRSRAGGIDDEGEAVCFGDFTDGVEVGDFEGGVGDCFAEEGARFVVDSVRELLGVLGIDKADFDAEGGEDVFELGISAAVEVLGGDDVIAGLGEVDDGVEDGGGAGGVGETGEFVSTFEKGNAFF